VALVNAVVQRDGAADRFQRQEGDRAKARCWRTRAADQRRRSWRGSAARSLPASGWQPTDYMAPDAVYPLPPCHLAELPGKRSAEIPSKDWAKIYVAILRCNIRDLAYLGTAQISAILLNPRKRV